MNMVADASIPAFGRLLRQWRGSRGFTQLGLAVEAGISTRHLSFIETGRARPSREMVELLASMLELPLEVRNSLLLAAGYAPRYVRRGLEEPDLDPVNRALQFILRQQEPYPALVVDGTWNVVSRNSAADRIFGLFLDAPIAPSSPPANTMRSVFHPKGIRQYIINWEERAFRMLYKIRRDAAQNASPALAALRDELLSYPGVAELWKTTELQSPAPALMTIDLRRGPWALSFFTTLSTVGLPCDLGLQDLRVECFFPADAATDTAVRSLAADVYDLLPA